MLITTILLNTACGKETKNESSTEKPYSFTVNNLTFELGSEFNAEDYGEYVDYSETSSCAFDGLDKTYTYDHYEITTYPKEDKDYIYSIYFLDLDVKTSEGVAIDDSKDKMIETYGDKHEEEDGFYIYTKDKTQLRFGLQNDKIISIEYLYI